MSVKYLKKIYSIVVKEGFIPAIKYDFKATIFSLDSRLSRVIDYISDYCAIKEIRTTNTPAANEMEKILEASRKLTKQMDLEMLLDL